jgi:hypothetical protein
LALSRYSFGSSPRNLAGERSVSQQFTRITFNVGVEINTTAINGQLERKCIDLDVLLVPHPLQ